MSEFGNETTTATLRTTEKTMAALMKLLKYILESNERKVSKELRKEQLAEMKSRRKGELYGKGYIRAKRLFDSGEKLRPLSVKMNKEELENFEKYSKIYGFPYTSVSDTKSSDAKKIKNELDEIEKKARTEGLTKEDITKRDGLQAKLSELEMERQERIVIIREKDLALVKEVTDRMNEDIQLNDICNEIEKEKDVGRLEALNEERNNILTDGISEFNKENAEIIFNKVSGEMEKRSLSFDKALNRFTDRDYSRNVPYFACERSNPNRYIEMFSSRDEYRGNAYTKTDYKVYRDGIEQNADPSLRKDGKFSDERFDGRNGKVKGLTFWAALKADIKEKGGFSDDIIIFDNKKDFEKYKALYEEKVESVNLRETKMDIVSGDDGFKDYAGRKKQIEEQLKEKGFEVNSEGMVCRIDTKEPLTVNGKTTFEEKVAFLKMSKMAEQIATYTLMNKGQNNLAMKNQQFEKEPSNELKESIEKIEKFQKYLETKESKLIAEINQINGMEVLNSISKEKGNEEIEVEIPHGEEEETMEMDDWKESINKERSSTEIKMDLNNHSLEVGIEME